MNAEFVSLADMLRPPRVVVPNPGAEGHAVITAPEYRVSKHDVPHGTMTAPVAAADGDPIETLDRGAGPVSVRAPSDEDPIAASIRDARLFRARLDDALDHAAARLVRELAADVLMRELRLAPCEIAALVQRVRERAPVVRVRVAAADVGRVRGVPVVADPALAAGDAVVELCGGALDARLGVRLAGVLEAFA